MSEITTKEILDLLDRYQRDNNEQISKLTDSMASMAESVNEFAIVSKVAEERHINNDKRMEAFEKRLTEQGKLLTALTTKVEKNTWFNTGAVKGFWVLFTAFCAGVATIWATSLLK